MQNILTDLNLTLQAKAIYLYFVQESQGKQEFIMKSPNQIQHELGIGTYQYYSHLHKLIDAGYIKIIKTRSNKNRYSSNKCILKTEVE